MSSTTPLQVTCFAANFLKVSSWTTEKLASKFVKRIGHSLKATRLPVSKDAFFL